MRIHGLLADTAHRLPGHTALSSSVREATYTELLESTFLLAKQFRAYGIQCRVPVAIFMRNSHEFVETLFGLDCCGAVPVPVYVQTGIAKLAEMARYFGLKYFVADPYTAELLAFAHNQLPPISIIVVSGGNVVSCHQVGGDAKSMPPHTEPGLILFTSGTTRIPKGVMLSHDAIVANVEAISEYLCLVPGQRLLLLKNMTHASTIVGEILVSVRNGCTLLIHDQLLVPGAICEAIEKLNVSVLFAVPSLLVSLLNDRRAMRHYLPSLKVVHFYGSPMSPQRIDELSDWLPHVKVIYSYGLTEAGPRVTQIDGSQMAERRGSCGRAINGVHLDIVDQSDRSLPPQDIGEIVVSSPSVMTGYWCDEVSTNCVIRDGRLHTGDIGYLDDDGYLYVIGRRDNRFTHAGRNVYPEEIETVIGELDGVKEVLVNGGPDPRAGNVVIARVTLRADSHLTVDLIHAHCRRSMEDYKVPKSITIVDELPRTASGKVVRGRPSIEV